MIRIRACEEDANAYLYVDGGEALLFDAGSGADAEGFLGAVEGALGRARLVGVLLTHGHGDHSGGAGQAGRRFGAPVRCHPADRLPFEPVAEGDAFACGSSRWVAMHTPGHTAGGVCYLCREASMLVSGDTAFPYGAFGRFDFPTGDAGQLLASLERLSGLDVDAVYPGHDLFVETDGQRHLRASHAALKTFLSGK